MGRWRPTGSVGLLGLIGLAVACSSAAPPAASTTAPASGSATGGSSTTGAAPTGQAAAWTTYQHDSARTGAVAERTAPSVHRAWTSPTLDGAVYAQPLLIGDAVIVATEHDSLYRLDAVTGAVRWQTNLGRPVPGGELPCGNIDPVGITGTPVLDVTAGLVWAVAFVEPHRHELVAVDLATGAVRDRRPVDPPGSDPSAQQERAALTLANGRIYVAFGGLYGDCGNYRGWVVATAAQPAAAGAGPPPLLSWHVPTGRGGGIWAPSGVTVDASGALYVATGNSFDNGTYDQGNSVVMLSPALAPQDSFAPTDWARLNAGDADVGSIGPALVGDGLLFQAGKAGIGFLVAAGHLGGVGGELFRARICDSSRGGTAWSPPLLFVPCLDGLVAVRIAGRAFSIAWRGPSQSFGPPVVTHDEVWAVALDSGQLVAFDRASGAVQARIRVGRVPHFAAPAVGGGRIVVPSGRGVVAFSA